MLQNKGRLAGGHLIYFMTPALAGNLFYLL